LRLEQKACEHLFVEDVDTWESFVTKKTYSLKRCLGMNKAWKPKEGISDQYLTHAAEMGEHEERGSWS
jgi:hypothetical protein